jgi:hypothetical protein
MRFFFRKDDASANSPFCVYITWSCHVTSSTTIRRGRTCVCLSIMKYVRKHIKSLSPEFNVNFKGNDEREANSALCYLPVADCEVDDGKNVGKHPACSASPRIITVIMFTTSMVITLGAQETCYCLHLLRMLTTPETHNPSALGRRCYYCQLYCVLSNLNSCYIIRYW